MKNLITSMFLGAFTLTSAFAAGPSCDEFIQQIKASAGSTTRLEILIPKLPDIEVICTNPELAEKQIIAALWKLEQQKRLDSAIRTLIRKLKAEKKFPQLANLPEEMAVATLGLALRSEFYDRGLYNPGFVFAGWAEITKKPVHLMSSLLL